MTPQQELRRRSSPQRAKTSAGFFKTGKGQYGEGDIFIGVTVPDTRDVAKRFLHISLSEIQSLLNSKIHEERMLGLMVLCGKYNRASEKERETIYTFYVKNLKNVNNWDLVDLSAHTIVGQHIMSRNKDNLYKLSKSDNLWERRISIVATYWFIKNDKFDDTMKISEILLNDKHDLIQKAVGWMLREVGKRDVSVLERFLKRYSKEMPRTMLRYAIERFPENKRKRYLR